MGFILALDYMKVSIYSLKEKNLYLNPLGLK